MSECKECNGPLYGHIAKEFRLCDRCATIGSNEKDQRIAELEADHFRDVTEKANLERKVVFLQDAWDNASKLAKALKEDLDAAEDNQGHQLIIERMAMKAIKVCWSETTTFVCKITQEDIEGTEYTLEGLLEDPWEAVALTYEWELSKDSTYHDGPIAEAVFIEEER